MKSLGESLTEYFNENLEWKTNRYILQKDGTYKGDMISAQERMEWGTKRFVKEIVDLVAHPEKSAGNER